MEGDHSLEVSGLATMRKWLTGLTSRVQGGQPRWAAAQRPAHMQGVRGVAPRADMAQSSPRRSKRLEMIGRRAATGGAARRERTVPPGRVQRDQGLEDNPKWLPPGRPDACCVRPYSPRGGDHRREITSPAPHASYGWLGVYRGSVSPGRPDWSGWEADGQGWSAI